MATLDIDPDVARAWTPPGRFYASEEALEAVRERVFARSWQWLDLPELAPGEARPFTLLPGFLDEPLLATREAGGDGRGREHVLSNVCTHRGYLVCTGAGSPKALRCGYHGRRFGLDGRFLHAPGFEGAEGFPSPADDLPRRPLERAGPLAFTTLGTPGEDAPERAEWLAPLDERLALLPLVALAPLPERSRDYEVACNWALYCENYLECLHVPFVHAALNDELVYDSVGLELSPWGSLQVGLAPEGAAAFEPGSAARTGEGGPGDGARVAAYYLWLFPNLMLNFYPWGLSLNLVTPLAADRTRVTYRGWAWRPELPGRTGKGEGAGGALHAVELEDDAVVEGVQRGVASRLYGRGRYAPAHERATHHFHRLLGRALA